MEHYALRIPQPTTPAPAGLRVLVVRGEGGDDGPSHLIHETLAVIALQSQVIHHYTSDDPRPVHPEPGLMERLGWHYKHHDCQYAPICITSGGRLQALDPDDPSWILLEPGTTDDHVEQLAHRLKVEERVRRALERSIENQDQGNVEAD